MRVLTWNIDQFAGDRSTQEELIARCAPDAVMLQEVKGWYVRRLRDVWPGEVVAGIDHHPEATANWISAVLLLPPDAELRATGMVDQLPRPQRAVWADVVVSGVGELHLVSWHNENAASDQSRKMAAFRGMTAHLAERVGGSVVVGGDLNTWRDPVELRAADPSDPFHDEHEFVGPAPAHGLVDGWRSLLARRGQLAGPPDGPLATSFRLRSGSAQRFDRLLVSPGVAVHDGAYMYEDGVAAGSDHGAHWLDITPPRRS